MSDILLTNQEIHKIIEKKSPISFIYDWANFATLIGFWCSILAIHFYYSKNLILGMALHMSATFMDGIDGLLAMKFRKLSSIQEKKLY
jgi:phosphatidylserine synthase